MKLLRLRLENFRQFRGEQEINFAADREQNVTLIYGANGSGKTTLLNALTWVLYETLSEDFEQPEKLYNDGEWSSISEGSRMNVAVELEFENAGSTLTMRRSLAVRKVDGQANVEQKAEAGLTYIDETGRSVRSGNPDEQIRRILPDRLHSFFFFNGERIDHLAKASAYEEIEDAIKTILGLKVVEQAIKHLPSTAKKFEELLVTEGTDELKEIASEQISLDQQVEAIGTKLEESKREAEHWQDELDDVSEKLRGSGPVKEKQRQRDELVAEDRRTSEAIDEIRERINRLVRERGFYAPALELFRSTSEQFADKREKRELPAPVKRDFIEALMDEGTCICGAPLEPGTSGHDHVSEWKQRSGLPEIEERWNQLHAHAGVFITNREEMRRDLKNLLSDRAKAMARQKHIREQLSELSAELKNATIDDIAALEGARIAAERNKEDEVRSQGRLERDLEGFEESRKELQTRMDRAERGEARAELARRRLTVTQQALSTLKKIFEIRTEQTRISLDERIKQVYGKITFKPNTPEVNPKFQLTLYKTGSGEPAAKSTGENQILGLSFVGALAAVARERFEETTKGSGAPVGARGGIYPIVMDAAFGTLDTNYQREIGLGLPELAEQVVVFVSKSHGRGAEEHLRSKVGRTYVIKYTTPKKDAVSETITIDQNEYGYIEKSDDGSEYAILSEAK